MVRLWRLWMRLGRDLTMLWRALKHPGKPIWLIPAALALAFYALEPCNFAIPLLGVVDDLLILPLLLHFVLTLLPLGVRSDIDRAGTHAL